VTSLNKGYLPPWVTLANGTDNTTISYPATGLLVLNTGKNAGLVSGYYFWNGVVWAMIATASGVFTRVNGTSSGNAGGGGVTETFNLNIPLNGGVTQQSVNITPKSLSFNTFIYLGY
jgi:hypothetical protein